MQALCRAFRTPYDPADRRVFPRSNQTYYQVWSITYLKGMTLLTMNNKKDSRRLLYIVDQSTGRLFKVDLV